MNIGLNEIRELGEDSQLMLIMYQSVHDDSCNITETIRGNRLYACTPNEFYNAVSISAPVSVKRATRLFNAYCSKAMLANEDVKFKGNYRLGVR